MSHDKIFAIQRSEVIRKKYDPYKHYILKFLFAGVSTEPLRMLKIPLYALVIYIYGVPICYKICNCHFWIVSHFVAHLI